jgi:hypothetical protein
METERFVRGLFWGLVATGLMSLLMIVATAIRPASGAHQIPILVGHRLMGLPIAATIVAHLAYGSLMGGVFAFLAAPMTLGKGIGFGLFLWFAMQITFVPALGWADFGLRQGTSQAAQALVFHLIYGAALGWLGARDDVRHHARFDEDGRLQLT